jgi:hypothetical protein
VKKTALASGALSAVTKAVNAVTVSDPRGATASQVPHNVVIKPLSEALVPVRMLVGNWQPPDHCY